MPITCQKSKSYINLLVKYWWLKNTLILKSREPFLSLTWELDFSQACSFHSMLMNHKNFDFTKIPDKTNNVIFSKSSKAMFLDHFWIFLPDEDFFQKIQLCHTQLYMLKRTYEQTEGGTGRPYFIGSFQPRPGIQQPLISKWLVGIHQILF